MTCISGLCTLLSCLRIRQIDHIRNRALIEIDPRSGVLPALCVRGDPLHAVEDIHKLLAGDGLTGDQEFRDLVQGAAVLPKKPLGLLVRLPEQFMTVLPSRYWLAALSSPIRPNFFDMPY